MPKAPNPLEGVNGYDAAGPIKDTFGQRVGERVKGNFNAPAQVDAVSQTIHDLGPVAEWPQLVMESTPTHLKENLTSLYQQAKGYIHNPAAIAGDVISGAVMHGISPEIPKAAKEEAPVAAKVAEPVIATPEPSAPPSIGNSVSTAARDIVGKANQTKVGRTALKIARHLPYGVGTVVKAGEAAAEFAPEATAAPKVAVPAEWGQGQHGTPVSQWGKTIPPEAPPPIVPPEPAPRFEAVDNAEGYPSGRPIDLHPGMQTPGGAVVAPRVKGLLPGEVDSPAPPVIAAPEQASPPPITPGKVEGLLSDSLGGKPLVPGVKLRDQPAAQGVKVPDGFTPVAESSAVKAFKYDPATREFQTITTNGSHYIHGDVSPEQAQAFMQADSKGQAFNQLKAGSTYVGKVVNGKRVAAQPPMNLRSASPDQPLIASPESNSAPPIRVPKKPAKPVPEEDLAEQLRESVRQAKAKRQK